MKPITVTISTRHRPVALERCLRSLSHAADLIENAIVVDDASDPPVDSAMVTRSAGASGIPTQVVRFDAHKGATAAKNAAARLARMPVILSLDDDAFLLSRGSVERALQVLEHDSRVAAIAFAQADAAGTLHASAVQPAGSTVPCYVPAFIGYGCLIARDRLLDFGGYREEFVIHGEEREISLRWLDAGYRVVYLPSAIVGHLAEPANRDPRWYARHVIRNDCINALYNEPFVRAAVSIPVRLWHFTRMAAQIPGGDPGGLSWIAGELVRRWESIRPARRPVQWRTLRTWRDLRDAPEYVAP